MAQLSVAEVAEVPPLTYQRRSSSTITCTSVGAADGDQDTSIIQVKQRDNQVCGCGQPEFQNIIPVEIKERIKVSGYQDVSARTLNGFGRGKRVKAKPAPVIARNPFNNRTRSPERPVSFVSVYIGARGVSGPAACGWAISDNPPT